MINHYGRAEATRADLVPNDAIEMDLARAIVSEQGNGLDNFTLPYMLVVITQTFGNGVCASEKSVTPVTLL